MTIDELRSWISAHFWKSDQIAAWAERNFWRRNSYKRAGGTAAAGNLPIVTNSGGYVDPSFYDLSAIADDSLTLVDNVDPTKQAQFQLSSITAGQTRVLTVPNASGVLALLGLTQTWTAAQTYTDIIYADQGVRSGSITLNQDQATAIPTPNNHAVLLIFPYTGGASGYIAMARVRAGASPGIISLFNGGNTEFTTGVLTGTTGNTSRLTISPHTDGLCYIENRRPLTQTFDYTWL